MSNNERIGHLKGEAIYKQDNISKMFLSTATAMIATELTGVISVLMDGIITSRFLGVDAYSGIQALYKHAPGHIRFLFDRMRRPLLSEDRSRKQRRRQ